MNCLLAGLLLGAGIALIGIAIIGTGGLAAVAIVGAAATAGAGLGEVLSTMSWMPKETCGLILGVCSANVFTNGRASARAHADLALCSKHAPVPLPIATGSGTVFVNGLPAARVDDTIACSAVITSGSNNVHIGGGTAQTDQINSEELVPGWVHGALLVVGVGAAVVLGGPAIAIFGLLGGIGGGLIGGWAGGEIFGAGSDGQKWSALGGSVVGGLLGAKGATMLRAPKSPIAVPDEAIINEPVEPSAGVAANSLEMPEGIYADSLGVYGYLPKSGGRYASDMYDFSDSTFVARNRDIRLDYLRGSDALDSAIGSMKARGASTEQIANRVVWQRNSQKMEARSLMTEQEVKILEVGNLKRYGDPVGPTPKQLFDKYGDWEAVIQKSMEKDPSINMLLGIPGHR